VAEGLLRRARWDVRAFLMLAGMWTRVSWSYRTSFAVLTFASLVTTFLDFAAILVMFANVPALGGFGLAEIAFLYGTTSVSAGLADLVVGNVERLGQRIRLGSFDAMMVRPVGVLAQVCADQFAMRRLGRVIQGAAVLGWALAVVDVDWSVVRLVVLASMLVCGALIFTAFFVLGASFQFVSIDGSEVANAFTYGGHTLVQYPLTIYPRHLVTVLTFVLPVAFVNWYPALFVLGRPDPFGLPGWLRFASPLVALLLCALAGLAWRTGVRHYRSTGS